MADPELILDLPWVPQEPERLDGLTVRRGRHNKLSYDDGITLEVCIVDPGGHRTLDELLDELGRQGGAGRVALVAGAVPLQWRSQLRAADVSFIDVSGVAEIRWPRLKISARRLGKPAQRRTVSVPMQKSHALIAQELLITSLSGVRVTIGDIALGTGASLSSVSRSIAQLAAQGLVAKEREGRDLVVSVVDAVELANLLAERSAWGRGEVLWGYLWGRNTWDVAARLSLKAAERHASLAVTGRVGAAFYGIVGTASPPTVRCWVDTSASSLSDVAGLLGLEPAPEDEANVGLSADRWRIGMHRREERTFEEWKATVAHPIRVWCDLRDEQRGDEFAAQMWGLISDVS
ncbi:MAG: hypothetical protein M5T61_04230 [Acidimicrobiia bacterium]|nr:hypothetical protein [Acidimicrobiia bacterium]